MTKPSSLLRQAADDLLNLELPKNASFDMSTWGRHEDGPKPSFDNLCGTAACAAGWLSTMPQWQARGFRSKWQRIKLPVFYGNPGYRWELAPGNRYRLWENMGADVFQIDVKDTDRLFSSRSRSRATVVEEFEDVAEKYEAMDL